jgi:hypothetical protein
MSEILVRWIRDDIGIPQVSSDLEKECANGFVIGKILNRYGLFPELDKLQNKATPEIGSRQRPLPIPRNLSEGGHKCNKAPRSGASMQGAAASI